MIRDICKDETFLAQRAQPAAPEDLTIADDLRETLAHHKDRSVGMAANMIGDTCHTVSQGLYSVLFLFALVL